MLLLLLEMLSGAGAETVSAGRGVEADRNGGQLEPLVGTSREESHV